VPTVTLQAMDPSPTVTVVLAALLTGALSVCVQLIANWHARKMAAADRTAQLEGSRVGRQYEARERRYEDRRDAVIALDREAEKQTDSFDRHFRESGGIYPGAYHDTDVFEAPELFAAGARVKFLATPDVSLAAAALVASVERALARLPPGTRRLYRCVPRHACRGRPSRC
jgi:hypothetical protein